MSYEFAPGTALVATHCAACGRPLLDAVSVEIGMGPTCRKKYGLGGEGTGADWSRAVPLLGDVVAAVEGDARATANHIVHRVAADQGAAVVPALLAALESLGFARVAEAIREHLRPASVSVTEDGDRYVVTVSGLDRESFDALVAALRAIRGRRYDADRKASLVPCDRRRELWTALRASLRPGTPIVGSRGMAVA